MQIKISVKDKKRKNSRILKETNSSTIQKQASVIRKQEATIRELKEKLEEQKCCPINRMQDEISGILYQDPVITVYWKDGTSTEGIQQEPEDADVVGAFVDACIKKCFGSRTAMIQMLEEQYSVHPPEAKRFLAETGDERRALVENAPHRGKTGVFDDNAYPSSFSSSTAKDWETGSITTIKG